MNEAQIRNVIKQQKKLGKKPNEILAMASDAKVNLEPIIPLLEDYFENHELDDFVSLDYKNKEYWDPVGESIDINSFSEERHATQSRLDKLISKEVSLRNFSFIYFSIGLVLPQVILIALIRSDNSDFWLTFYLYLGVNFIFWLPYLANRFYVKKDEKDLVKILLAQKNNWVYNPSKRKEKANLLTICFPWFFRETENRQSVEDEFWGTFYSKESFHDFYVCLYSYYESKGQRVNNKQGNLVFETAFAIKLNKSVESTLLLVPQSKSRFWRQKFETIDVESTEFNKAFEIYKNGELDQEELIKIFTNLSPAVQITLLELVRNFPGCKFGFENNVIWFSRRGYLFPDDSLSIKCFQGDVDMHTNFMESFELDPRDEDYLQKYFNDLLKIGTNVSKYLR